MVFPEELRQFLENIGFYEKIKGLTPEDLMDNEEKPDCEHCPGFENCPTHGYIKVIEEVDGKTYIAYAKCSKLRMEEEKKRYERNIRTSGLPKIYLGKTFDNFDVGKNGKAIKRIKEYLQNKEWKYGKGLYLTGTVGCGKTHLAAAIVHELAKQNVYTLFIFVPDFLDEIRSAYGEKEQDEEREDPFELARESTILILDDLGTEKVTEWANEKLLQLINHRAGNNLATIITSNYTIDQIKDRLGERIASRIRGMCEELMINGEDRRSKKGGL
jgi:DNA replication protein DnaC